MRSAAQDDEEQVDGVGDNSEAAQARLDDGHVAAEGAVHRCLHGVDLAR